MASAKATGKMVEKIVTTQEEVKVIVLELSVREAETLRHVLSLCGGDPRTTRRGDTDSINYALAATGVTWPRRPFRDLTATASTIASSGSFIFQE